MTSPNPYRQYQATQVQTAGPAQLTMMCYDGALRALTQAREAMLARRYDAQHAAIDKAQALLSELLKGLDYHQGGEVAQNLDRLYRYLYDRLTHASVRDDVGALDEVRNHLTELRAAWDAIVDGGTGASALPALPRRDVALSI